MKAQGYLVLIVTVIDLATAWPFQGPVLRGVDLVLLVGLLWVLRSPPPATGMADFGVGERVLLRGPFPAEHDQPARTGEAYGTVLGAAPVPGLLRVRFDYRAHERFVAPASLAKISLWAPNYAPGSCTIGQ